MKWILSIFLLLLPYLLIAQYGIYGKYGNYISEVTDTSDVTAPTAPAQFIVSSSNQDSIRHQMSGWASDLDSVRVMRQLNSYPTNKETGTLVFVFSASDTASYADTSIYLQYSGNKTWYYRAFSGDRFDNWSAASDTVQIQDVTPPDSFLAISTAFIAPNGIRFPFPITDIDSADWGSIKLYGTFLGNNAFPDPSAQTFTRATLEADSVDTVYYDIDYNFTSQVATDTLDTLQFYVEVYDTNSNYATMATVDVVFSINMEDNVTLDTSYIVDISTGNDTAKVYFAPLRRKAAGFKNSWVDSSRFNVRPKNQLFVYPQRISLPVYDLFSFASKTLAQLESDSLAWQTLGQVAPLDSFVTSWRYSLFQTSPGFVAYDGITYTYDTLAVPDTVPPSPTGNFIAFGSPTLGYDSLAIRWQDSSATDITDSLIIAIFNQGTKPSSVDTTTADTVLRFNRFSELQDYGQDWIVSDGDPDTLHLFGVFDDSLGNFIKWANADYDYTYISPTPGATPDTDPPNTDSLQIAFVRVNFALFDSTGSPSDSPDVAYYIDSVKTEPSGSYSLIRTGSTVAYSRDSTSLAANFPTFESKAGNDTLYGKTVAVDTAGNKDATGYEYKKAPSDTNFAYYINPDSLELIDIRNGDITAMRFDISAGDSVSEGAPYYILSFEDTLTTFDFGDTLVIVIDSLHFDFAGNDSVYQRVALYSDMWGDWSDWFLSTEGTEAGGGGGSLTFHTTDTNYDSGAATTAARAQHPDNMANGDLVIIIGNFKQARPISVVPTGFTLIRRESDQADNGTVPSVAAYYKVITDAGSEPDPWLFNFDSEMNYHFTTLRFTGQDATPIDQDNGDNSASSGVTSIAIPSITATEDGILIASYACRDAFTVTDVATMTLIQTGNNAGGYGTAYENISSGATGTRTITISSASRSAALMFNLK